MPIKKDYMTMRVVTHPSGKIIYDYYESPGMPIRKDNI